MGGHREGFATCAEQTEWRRVESEVGGDAAMRSAELELHALECLLLAREVLDPRQRHIRSCGSAKAIWSWLSRSRLLMVCAMIAIEMAAAGDGRVAEPGEATMGQIQKIIIQHIDQRLQRLTKISGCSPCKH
jgi:hypothetical protein